VNRWCKHLTAVSDGRLNDAHGHILLPIELHTKKLYSCKISGSYVPNLVKIGALITSHSCPQTPDGRMFTWFYIMSNAYA